MIYRNFSNTKYTVLDLLKIKLVKKLSNFVWFLKRKKFERKVLIKKEVLLKASFLLSNEAS